jgi:hypothetical protein
VGGPIVHDKLFFFFDSERIRIALPIVTATTVPTPAFQSYVLQQLPLGGTDSVTGSVYPPSPQSVPFYQKMFSLYGNTTGTPLMVLGCPFDVGGVLPAIVNDGNGCTNRQSVSHSSDDHEQVQTVRIDYNTSAKRTPPGFGFRPIPESKPPLRIRSIPCSTLFLLKRCTPSQRDICMSFRRIW